MRIILGSQSPQRREILGFYSLPFEQQTPNFTEESIPFEGEAVAYAQRIAMGKAESLAPHFPNAIILTADTVVFKEGKIFNKPENEEQNFEMLKELNGSWHSVFTSVVAISGAKHAIACEETKVLFHHLDDSELLKYHKAFKGTDKAGGYSIQKGGNLIVQRIEGCFYNVMGFPLGGLKKVLMEVGINLWDYLNY